MNLSDVKDESTNKISYEDGDLEIKPECKSTFSLNSVVMVIIKQVSKYQRLEKLNSIT